MDTKKIKQAVSQIDAAQKTLKRELAKSQPKNRPTKAKIPDEDPEAQALVREKYRLGITHAGVRLTEAQIKQREK
jgi:hypothetical protein